MNSYEGRKLKLLSDMGYKLVEEIIDLTPLQKEFLVMAREMEEVERQKMEALKNYKGMANYKP